MKTQKFITLVLLSVLILTSCSNHVETESSQKVQSVSSGEASKINVKEYFPPLVTRNQYISPNDDGSNQIIIEVSKFAIGLNNDTERIIESTNYQGNVELGRSAIQYNVTKTEIKDDKENIDLTNKSHWESDGMDLYMVSSNKSVQVQAGTFENCIEILRIEPETQWEARITYAPNVGVIKLTSKSKDKEEKVLVELTSTDTAPYGVNTQNNPINEGLPDEDGDLEHESASEGSVVKTTVESINDMTSKLSLNEYAEKVNKLSMEQAEYSILHRPSFQEENSYDLYNFVANTSEDIVIVTDKKSFIKQVSWNSKELITEEILLDIQWLILSLDNSISIEKVNEFLFHESLIEQRFGDFLVKFNKSENGFNINVLAE